MVAKGGRTDFMFLAPAGYATEHVVLSAHASRFIRTGTEVDTTGIVTIDHDIGYELVFNLLPRPTQCVTESLSGFPLSRNSLDFPVFRTFFPDFSLQDLKSTNHKNIIPSNELTTSS